MGAAVRRRHMSSGPPHRSKPHCHRSLLPLPAAFRCSSCSANGCMTSHAPECPSPYILTHQCKVFTGLLQQLGAAGAQHSGAQATTCCGGGAYLTPSRIRSLRTSRRRVRCPARSADSVPLTGARVCKAGQLHRQGDAVELLGGG